MLDAGKHLANEILADVRRRRDPERDAWGYLTELRAALDGELGMLLMMLRPRTRRAS